MKKSTVREKSTFLRVLGAVRKHVSYHKEICKSQEFLGFMACEQEIELSDEEVEADHVEGLWAVQATYQVSRTPGILTMARTL